MSEQDEQNPEPLRAGPVAGDVTAHGSDETSSTDPKRTGELDELKARLQDAEARASENLEGWQRSQAEFQNFRKRVERDMEVTQGAMKADIIRQVLPILDDLERALENRPSDSGPWASGIELIHRKLQGILEGQGVKRIEAAGVLFDPNLHEAISHEPFEGVPSGHVIAVTQHGYLLGDRVIRPATVRVAQ